MNDETVYVQHMLDAIEQIEKYTEDLTAETFHERTIVQDAVIRQLEILGEAASRLSEETRSHYDDVPWQDITGMRNKLIHGYFGVDIDVVWATVIEDDPRLKSRLAEDHRR